MKIPCIDFLKRNFILLISQEYSPLNFISINKNKMNSINRILFGKSKRIIDYRQKKNAGKNKRFFNRGVTHRIQNRRKLLLIYRII